MDPQIQTIEHINVFVLHILQELTALKSLGKRTVTEFVKMGHAFKCHLPPSNASVTQDSLAHHVRAKPPVIQIHAEMVAYAKRTPKDLFVIVQKDFGASTVTPGWMWIACHMDVRRNKFALQGSTPLNVSARMVMWSQHAGGSRTCVAHHRVSTMPPVCPREMIMSADVCEGFPGRIVKK